MSNSSQEAEKVTLIATLNLEEAKALAVMFKRIGRDDMAKLSDPSRLDQLVNMIFGVRELSESLSTIGFDGE